jgi:hypothetical protein
MGLHLARPIAGLIDRVGAACAFVIILGMLATALAPVFVPLLHF